MLLASGLSLDIIYGISSTRLSDDEVQSYLMAHFKCDENV